jgi:S-adenosylmethionine-diacylglycerol 3-amino-3-carboxypropyl transferase
MDHTRPTHACHSDKPRLMRRCADACFNTLYRRSLIYNTCWEDPAVDRQALTIGTGDRLAVITSAGCNVLDYALCAPRSIDAVDANPKQTALLELKLAAIKRLEFDDFFRLFGRGRHPGIRPLYRTRLRPELSRAARDFWDRRIGWFDPRGDGFYYQGLAGRFARVFRAYVGTRPRLRQGLARLLQAPDLATQAHIYTTEVAPLLFGPVLRWLLDRHLVMSCLGVPQAQSEEVRRQGGGIGEFVAGCLNRVCTALPLHDNYFWQVYLRGHYLPDCCPEYLKPGNFRRLQAGLVEVIRPHTMTLSEFFRRHPGRLDACVLLDHMDWMADHDPAALQEEWNLLLGRARPGARILFRSAAPIPTYLQRLRVGPGSGRPLEEVLCYRRDLAARLHRQDRVGTYGGLHIADLLPAGCN